MAVIDLDNRAVEARIVYYGPALSGKTTNLQVLHDLLPVSQHGTLTRLDDQEHRTVFFDYLPVDARLSNGFRVQFRVYSVSGQLQEEDSRMAVLSGCDGVVFVADAGVDRIDENRRSIEELRASLQMLRTSEGLLIPVVIQYNKLDMDEIAEPDDLRPNLECGDETVVLAAAIQGRGVVETFEEISRQVIENL